MNNETVIWIVAIYAATVIIGYVVKYFFFKLGIDKEAKLEDINKYYNVGVLITVLLYIPILNFYISWLMLKLIFMQIDDNKESKNINEVADTLKEHFKNHPNPELREKINKIADDMKKL